MKSSCEIFRWVDEKRRAHFTEHPSIRDKNVVAVTSKRWRGKSKRSVFVEMHWGWYIPLRMQGVGT